MHFTHSKTHCVSQPQPFVLSSLQRRRESSNADGHKKHNTNSSNNTNNNNSNHNHKREDDAADEEEKGLVQKKEEESFFSKVKRFVKRERRYESRTVYLGDINQLINGHKGAAKYNPQIAAAYHKRKSYPANVIRNQKYNPFTFIFVILYEQFRYVFVVVLSLLLLPFVALVSFAPLINLMISLPFFFKLFLITDISLIYTF